MLAQDAVSASRSSAVPPETSAEPSTQKLSPAQQPKQVWWLVVGIVAFFHLVSLAAIRFYTPKSQTLTLVLVTWIVGGMGITMGYHRLWSHNAFSAHIAVRAALAFAGVLAFQGSIKWWGLRHRLHHRYTDTEHDPYDATRGFWYSHMGWLFEKPEYTRLKWIDRTDLEADPVVEFQHKHFPQMAIAFGIVLPTLLGAMWGDALGGFLYGGYVSRIILWHTTWFINSLAHSWGEQEYSTENTSRGNMVLALLTHGEGHHNFHHEFPRDYRNGIKTLDWDPTKWMIAGLSYLNLTYNLRTIPDDVIYKAQIAAAEDKIKHLSKGLIWTDETKLPVWTFEEYKEEAKASQALILIDGYAVDISEFKSEHPGGEKLVTNYIGKDATKSFYGVLNNHTKSARQIMKDLRVAKVERSDKKHD
ncbi:hypothetical protein HDV03_001250 [Kappamyces sp. JEL0829]|nr:hypothetical protein HDV03_001250 [Kappamyces sp. JEL0829]